MQGRTTSPARGPPPGVGATSARMLLGFSDRDVCMLSCSHAEHSWVLLCFVSRVAFGLCDHNWVFFHLFLNSGISHLKFMDIGTLPASVP